jgi:uncharacterized protein (TIGR00297 family)
MRSAKITAALRLSWQPDVMHRSRAPIRCVWKKLAGWLDCRTGFHPNNAKASLGTPGWAAAMGILPWPALGAQLYSLIPQRRVLWALGFTVAFAVSARLLRAVTVSGTVAGGVLAFLLFVAGGPGAFAALIAVFLLTWVTTRLGHRRKRQLGTAEGHSGRSASQILANVGIAAATALVGLASRHPAPWLVASAAALAEAAADTTSSEVGQAVSDSAYLITDFRPVPVGTDGGISVAGTLAGIAAAAAVAAVCAATRMIAWHWWLPVSAAGVLGMFVDSFLGASFERRRLLNNDAVNLLSTIAAALFLLFLYWSRQGKLPLL